MTAGSFVAHGEEFDQLCKHAIAVPAGEGERKLRDEQTVRCADVESPPGDVEGKIAAS